MRLKRYFLIVLISVLLSLSAFGVNEEILEVPFLGVKIDDAAEGGVKVTDIQDGSPAHNAGFQIGDIMKRWGDRKMEDSSDFMLNLYSQNPGDKVVILLARGNETRQMSLKLGKSPDEYADVYNNIPMIIELFRIEMMGYAVDEMGIITGNIPPALIEYFEVDHGVLVQYVEPGSRGEKKGFKPGDVIYSINGVDIPHTILFRSEVDKARNLKIKFKRKGTDLTINMRKKEIKD